MSTRIGLTITDEMDAIIEKIAAQQDRRKSDIVRYALEEYLKEHGYTLSEKLEYGGDRTQQQ